MNYKLTITLTVLIGLYGCQQESDQAVVASQAEPGAAPATTEIAAMTAELVSGIDP